MPNWCDDVLDIAGAPECIEALLAAFAGRTDDDDAVPMPLSFAATRPFPIGPDGEPVDDVLDWCVANWGTKWDLDERTRVADLPAPAGTRRVRFDFATAWSPPLIWLIDVARDWPELTFELLFWEGGNGFAGHLVIIDGRPVATIAAKDTAGIDALLARSGFGPIFEDDDEDIDDPADTEGPGPADDADPPAADMEESGSADEAAAEPFAPVLGPAESLPDGPVIVEPAWYPRRVARGRLTAPDAAWAAADGQAWLAVDADGEVSLQAEDMAAPVVVDHFDTIAGVEPPWPLRLEVVAGYLPGSPGRSGRAAHWRHSPGATLEGAALLGIDIVLLRGEDVRDLAYADRRLLRAETIFALRRLARDRSRRPVHRLVADLLIDPDDIDARPCAGDPEGVFSGRRLTDLSAPYRLDGPAWRQAGEPLTGASSEPC